MPRGEPGEHPTAWLWHLALRIEAWQTPHRCRPKQHRELRQIGSVGAGGVRKDHEKVTPPRASAQTMHASIQAAAQQAIALLKEYGALERSLSQDADLPRLGTMKAHVTKIDALAPMLRDVPGWAALQTNTTRMQFAIGLGGGIQTRTVALAGSPEELVRLTAPS